MKIITPKTKEVPKSIPVTAGIFIFIALLMVFQAVRGLTVAPPYTAEISGLMEEERRKELYSEALERNDETIRYDTTLFGDSPGARTLNFILTFFQHYRGLAIVEIALALLVVTASIFFLKLRAWSRYALIVSAWGIVIYTLVYSAFWLYMMINILFFKMYINTGAKDLDTFIGFSVELSVMVFIVIIPLGFVINSLSKRSVREVMGTGQ